MRRRGSEFYMAIYKAPVHDYHPIINSCRPTRHSLDAYNIVAYATSNLQYTKSTDTSKKRRHLKTTTVRYIY